jgi:hypothetical protein
MLSKNEVTEAGNVDPLSVTLYLAWLDPHKQEKHYCQVVRIV